MQVRPPRALNVIHKRERCRAVEPGGRIFPRSRGRSLSPRAVNCGSLVRINGLAVAAVAADEHDQASGGRKAGLREADFMNY